MRFKTELNDFCKTRFMQRGISLWDYYVIISAIYFNYLFYQKMLPCKDLSSLMTIIILSILIYVIVPKTYLYFLKKSAYKGDFKIRDNNFYINNIPLERFRKGRNIYCKEYDTIILLGVITPKLICKYKSRIFLINKSDIKDIHLKILEDFHTPTYTPLE